MDVTQCVCVGHDVCVAVFEVIGKHCVEHHPHIALSSQLVLRAVKDPLAVDLQ